MEENYSFTFFFFRCIVLAFDSFFYLTKEKTIFFYLLHFWHFVTCVFQTERKRTGYLRYHHLGNTLRYLTNFTPCLFSLDTNNQHLVPRNRVSESKREFEMERKELLVCCVVGLLGLVSAATGFAAEATRIKVKR